MKTMMALGLALTMLVAPTASAYDTKVDRLHQVDKKIVEVLTKKKLSVTIKLREHFAGWTVSKIKGWAKRNRLDQDAFLKVVYQVQLIEAKPVTPQIAHLLVYQCNIAGMPMLAGTSGSLLQPCVARQAARYGLNPTPTVEDVQAWVDAGKATGNHTAKANWASRVMISRFHQKDEKVAKALTRKKWGDNLLVYENLKLSADRDKFAKRYKVDVESVRRYAAYADLTRLKSINPAVAHMLYLANIKGLPLLGGQNAATLHKALADVNTRHKVIPRDVPIELVEKLINEAKSFQ